MSILFEPTKIKKMELRNRFIRSATFDGCADQDGRVSEKQFKIFDELAQGGVGCGSVFRSSFHTSIIRHQAREPSGFFA